jgi:hypothetical protein
MWGFRSGTIGALRTQMTGTAGPPGTPTKARQKPAIRRRDQALDLELRSSQSASTRALLIFVEGLRRAVTTRSLVTLSRFKRNETEPGSVARRLCYKSRRLER